MQRVIRGVLVTLLTMSLLGGLAQASTLTGQAIQIGGFDDMAATVDAQARGGAGRMGAYFMGSGSFLSLVSGYVVPAALMGAGAIGLAFVPRIVNSTFDSTPAATGVLDAPRMPEAWWTPFLAFLYPLMLSLRFLRDPAMLACFAVSLLLAVRYRRPQHLAIGG